jgi:hypothetical protein
MAWSSLIATAAPTATPVPDDPALPVPAVFTVAPSPTAEPVVAFDEESVSEPPAVTRLGPRIVASAVELETLTAMAAATDTDVPLDDDPLEAEAEGAEGLAPSVPEGASPSA